MSKKTFLVTDLGGGDGGKGGVVHKIASQMKAHTVLKVGGGQGSHGVRTSSGQSFNFSHFGCGTFEGVRTHITNKMVIDPLALYYEGELLKYEHNIRNVFNLLTVEEDVLCVTPYHRIASQLRELSRKTNPKGTVGVGIGEAVSDFETHPELSILVSDLFSRGLREKLEDVRQQKKSELSEIINGDFLDSDRETAAALIASLDNSEMIGAIVEYHCKMASMIRIVDWSYLENDVLSRDGNVVIETSHGVLTDRYYGFHPHTTKLRTMPSVSLNLLNECGYNGEVVKIGVTRAYQIRHGAGPMVTEDTVMLSKLLPGSSKDENRWQGKVRVGPLDFVALRYAINACGGSSMFDGIAVTWFDQIPIYGSWDTCDSYTGTNGNRFFSSDSEIIVHTSTDDESQLFYQQKLGETLRKCQPVVDTRNISPNSDTASLVSLCGEVVEDKLKVPLVMLSLGPTEDHKICI